MRKAFKSIREKRAAARERKLQERRSPHGFHKPVKPRNRLQRITRFPRMMLWALYMEGVETRDMIRTYAKHGKGSIYLKMEGEKPSKEELKQAKEQLLDLPKFLPFFVLVVVPVPGVTEGYALMAVTVEKWLGLKVSLLPSQLSKLFRKDKEE